MKTSARVKVIVGIAVVVSLSLMVGGYTVYAASTDSSQSFPPVIEKLVKAFNLDRGKVATVLGEYQQEQKADHKARLEEKLNQDVKDGTITAKQKDAILKKMDEMTANFEKFKDLSPEERRTAMEKQRTELQTWAKENGIDLTKIRFGFGFGRRGHGPGGMGFGGPGFGGPGRGFGGFGPGHFRPSDGSTPSASASKTSTQI